MSDLTSIPSTQQISVSQRADIAAVPATDQNAPPEQRGSRLGDLLRGLPTLLIVALLVGIAWWGHQSGWTMPKFSALFSNGSAAPDDWCKEHAVPESECVVCNPKLARQNPKAVWCEAHGVHNCPLDRPEAAQLALTPTITKEQLDRADRGLKFKKWPENNETCLKINRFIQFASDAVVDKMGVKYATVKEEPIVETVSASGELTFEQPWTATLYSAISGRVWKVTKNGKLGAAVKKGEILAWIDGAEVGKARVEFVQAFSDLALRQATFMRLKEGANVLPAAEIIKAEAATREANIRFQAAQQALANLGLTINSQDVERLSPEELAKRMAFLGLTPAEARELPSATTTANGLPIRATLDGTVIEVKTTDGEVVDPSKSLFVIADTSKLWLMLTVRPEDAKYIHVRITDPTTENTTKEGQVVKFQPDGGGPEVQGVLVWKSTLVDDKTRTLRYAAEVSNDRGLLVANTFGNARIIIREEKKAIVVPNEAVHWEGDCNVVFVRDKDWSKPGPTKLFHIRTVRPGVKDNLYTEIIAGLLPGEMVAVGNSAVLRAELLKNNLGAG